MITPSMTLRQMETAVNDTYSTARYGRMNSADLDAMVRSRFTNPVNSRTPSGRRRFSAYVAGYISGLIAAANTALWNEMEFCYRDAEGILYSTHKQSLRRSTNEFYDSGRGCYLSRMPCAHVWKDNRFGDREFTPFQQSPALQQQSIAAAEQGLRVEVIIGKGQMAGYDEYFRLYRVYDAHRFFCFVRNSNEIHSIHRDLFPNQIINTTNEIEFHHPQDNEALALLLLLLH